MKRILIFAALTLLLLMSFAQAETVLTAWNVGKADCLLLQMGDEKWLIDTGTVESWESTERNLLAMGVNELTGVVITHADKDHIGGATGLAASGLAVDAWYTSAFCEKYDESEHPAFLAAAERGQTVHSLQAGDELPTAAGKISVLWPYEWADDENENSLVLLVETEDGKILLMGDALEDDEKSLVNDGKIPACEILKVGHHGMNDATCKKLLSACRPRVAVISTDTEENDKTANEKVLKRLTNIGARIVLTQSDPVGVRLTLDKGDVSVTLLGETE